jgi:hypothetical protein
VTDDEAKLRTRFLSASHEQLELVRSSSRSELERRIAGEVLEAHSEADRARAEAHVPTEPPTPAWMPRAALALVLVLVAVAAWYYPAIWRVHQNQYGGAASGATP